MPRRACGPFLLALALTACGDSSVPSARENEQLDNAAEMLDEAPNALEGIDENALGDAGGVPNELAPTGEGSR